MYVSFELDVKNIVVSLKLGRKMAAISSMEDAIYELNLLLWLLVFFICICVMNYAFLCTCVLHFVLFVNVRG